MCLKTSVNAELQAAPSSDLAHIRVARMMSLTTIEDRSRLLSNLQCHRCHSHHFVIHFIQSASQIHHSHSFYHRCCHHHTHPNWIADHVL